MLYRLRRHLLRDVGDQFRERTIADEMSTVGELDIVDPDNLAGDKALFVDWHQMVAWTSCNVVFICSLRLEQFVCNPTLRVEH